MRVDSRELPHSAIPLCQLLPCHLWPPSPRLSLNLYMKDCLDCTTGAFHMSIPAEPLLRMRSRSSMPSCPSSSLDLVVTVSCGLTLQIYLIIALSFRCRCWRFGFVNGQVSLAWSIALRTQELYTRPHVLKERWREERTDSRSLNFFQVVFKRVVVESSQPPAAESISPRYIYQCISDCAASLADLDLYCSHYALNTFYQCMPQLTLVLLVRDMCCLCKQCRSRSVCHSVFEFVSTTWIK